MLDHFRMMAAYNVWANDRLFAAAALLSDHDYRADRGAFFRSLHGTLNHLLVTDRIWLHRLTGTGDVAATLDTILFDDCEGLAGARIVEDRRIVTFLEAIDQAELARAIRYRRVSTPESIEQPLGLALAHLFNHQTHHRGQAHAILTGLEAAAPSLDLLLFQREAGLAH